MRHSIPSAHSPLPLLTLYFFWHLTTITECGAWASTTDTQLTNPSQASCFLSLIAHSNHVLSTLPNSKAFISALLANTSAHASAVESRVETQALKARATCGTGKAVVEARVELGPDVRLVADVHFDVELTPVAFELPAYRGVIDRHCSVEKKKGAGRLYVKGMKILEMGRGECAQGCEKGGELVGSFGARHVVMDVRDEGMVEVYVRVGCGERGEREGDIGDDGGVVEVGKEIKVGAMREVLGNVVGVEASKQLMVAGFDVSGFE